MQGSESSFHLKPLSDEEIDELGISLSDVWMLQIEPEKVLGPFSTQMLRDDSLINPELYESCIVYNLVTEEWKNFYQLVEFQRRQPKLVPAQNLVKNESFLVLENGQKTGPFGLDELKESLQKRKISLNQEISVDEGRTWIKIYEHHAFDRRFRNSAQELPFPPVQDVFSKGEEKMALKAAGLQNQKEDNCAISGLAFIGRGNDVGQVLTAQENKKPVSKPVSAPEAAPVPDKIQQFFGKIKWKYAGGAAFAVLITFAGLNAFNANFSQGAPELGEAKKIDAKRIDNTDRATPAKTPVARKPANFDRSQGRTAGPAKYHKPNPVIKRRHAPAPKPTRVKPRPKKISHSYEDFENLDIEDPRVREELTRELAGDYYDSERSDQGHLDDQGAYVDDYPQEPSPHEAEPYERGNMEPAYEQGSPQQYPEETYPQESYPQESYPDEPAYESEQDPVPYEEVSDFE